MKCLTDQFNCVYVFALATLNGYILFLHWQRNWHPYDNLLIATYVLSCLWILVSNTVVDRVFTDGTSLLKMRKVVILNVFKTGINAVSFLSVF